MRNWLILHVLAACCFGCRAGENVIQPTEDVMVVEGQPTTLSCQFDTADLSPYLFWYKQQTNSNPMFMLRRDTFSSGETTTEFQERFDARLNFTAKSVPLTIQRVQLSESAVYYCALRPTVTTGIQPPYKNYRFHMSIETHCKTGCKAQYVFQYTLFFILLGKSVNKKKFLFSMTA
uniref:Ig-like domain-containing protein n=1 Tax=Hucho hucho TaxID=62062 RepID=A0A4W5KFQ0_9TELE